MTDRNATPTDTVIIRAPGGEEIRWRTQRMVSLGADPELAASIAVSDADLHDIERLLEDGCTLELAWAITRPVSEPRAVVPAAEEPAPED